MTDNFLTRATRALLLGNSIEGHPIEKKWSPSKLPDREVRRRERERERGGEKDEKENRTRR